MTAPSDHQRLDVDHERLDVWKYAMDLAAESYDIAKELPDSERYGLATQIRRAAVSIVANIAEGSGRSGPRDRLRFLNISRGSLSELRAEFSIVERLGHVDSARLGKARELSGTVFRLLNGLRRYVAAQVNPAASS